LKISLFCKWVCEKTKKWQIIWNHISGNYWFRHIKTQ